MTSALGLLIGRNRIGRQQESLHSLATKGFFGQGRLVGVATMSAQQTEP
jgi:hypothetical protein